MVAAAVAGAAVVGGVTSVVTGNKAAKAATKGAEAAAAASERGTDLQVEEARRQYDLTRADYQPYRDVGYGALGKLAGMVGAVPTNADGTPSTLAGAYTGGGTVATGMGPGYNGDGGFTASPGYAFRRDEGLKAIDRSNAARGILNSGGADKARMRYADGIASAEYDSYASRLAALAGVGQSATGATTAAGTAASGAIAGAYGANAVNQGNAALTAGNLRASSYQGIGGAINSTIGSLAKAYAYSKTPTFQTPGFGGSY